MSNHVIDTVILLPKNLLNSTSIPLACIILKKQPHQENAIRFIDASSLYTVEGHKNRLDVGKVMNAYHMDQAGISTTVGYDSILENDYSWNIPTYLQYEDKEIIVLLFNNTSVWKCCFFIYIFMLFAPVGPRNLRCCGTR